MFWAALECLEGFYAFAYCRSFGLRCGLFGRMICWWCTNHSGIIRSATIVMVRMCFRSSDDDGKNRLVFVFLSCNPLPDNVRSFELFLLPLLPYPPQVRQNSLFSFLHPAIQPSVVLVPDHVNPKTVSVQTNISQQRLEYLWCWILA